MNYFIRKQQIAQWIFITLGMFASLADAADLSTENLRVNSSASSAAIVAQPQTAIQNSTASPVATEAQTKKALTQPALIPGAEQSLNPQPLPPGGGQIEPMTGASIDMAKPRIDSGNKPSPGLIQPLPPGGGLIKPMSGARIEMAKPRIDSGIKASPGPIQSVTGTRDKTTTSAIGPGMAVDPWFSYPGQITGATVTFTATTATIRIEGSGSCALDVIDMHHGSQGPTPVYPRRGDEQPSYIGPLPTSIVVEAGDKYRTFVHILGAKDPESCGGYASVHLN